MDNKLLTVIATTAHNKKASKAAAFDAVNVLIDLLNEQGSVTPTLDVVDALATLYTQFTPPVPARPKTAFDWCGKAAAPKSDALRPHLQYVYTPEESHPAYEKYAGYMVGTDSHRLHLAPVGDELKGTGYFGKARTRVNVNHEYPNISRVLPTRDGWFSAAEVRVEASPTIRLEKSTVTPVLLHAPSISHPVALNKDYLYAALSGLVEPEYSFGTHPSDSILIRCKKTDRLAVVVGMRV